MSEETYCGPTTLGEALRDSGLAVSVPNGEYLAIDDNWGRMLTEIRIRRLLDASGHGGSVLGTGGWIDPKDVPPTILWRPG